MLQIKDIRKEYRTGDLVQTALDGVSLSLRDNEFVAILGPSGSGKTTLLNIIGGLDRYDSGDLIINNISTRKYTDRDWDSYRNHTIGFVFQSYNLIPHQSVLANVELALTISGVSRSEKRRKAIEALTKVGLGNQLHKKPNQMSGGQMQRVAIARALVNDPDILLADEPTGALDTQTSIQVMDLLKEVAKDRLVVMVTHNPELAEQYATRTVMLRDGRIISDSDPFVPETESTEAVHKNMGHASMSLLTSLSLSLNNLMTKRGRTILTAFAGSIGIIGIALILSLSNGVDQYIRNIEEDTLSEYPISITMRGLDYTAAFTGGQGSTTEETDENGNVINTVTMPVKPEGDDYIRERHTANTLFSGVQTNDLKSFKKFLDEKNDFVMSNANAIQYSYGVTPQIYRLDGDSYRQIHPDQTMKAMGVSYGNFGSFSMMDNNIFFSLPKEKALYEEQYTIEAGRWPENYHECVLVLNRRKTITDLVLYSIGLKDASELDAMIEKYNNGEEIMLEPRGNYYKYDEFLGLEFSIVNASDRCEFDAEYGVYVDKSDNETFMRSLVEKSEKMSIVGIVIPVEDANAAMLSYGVGFHHSLIDYTMEQAANSEIVKAQLANPEINVYTDKRFDEENKDSFDLSKIFSVDGDKLSSAFKFDAGKLNLDLSGLTNIDFSKVKLDLSKMDLSELSKIDFESILKDVNIRVSPEALQGIIQSALDEYAKTATSDPATDAQGYAQGFVRFLASNEGRTIIMNGLSKEIDAAGINESIQNAAGKISDQVKDVLGKQINVIMADVMSQLADQISGEMSKAMKSLSKNFKKAFKVDVDAFTGAIKVNIDPEELQSMMMSMYSTGATYDGNLSKLNYADKDSPTGIMIYPKDFDSKTALVEMIDNYNSDAKAMGENDRVIVYTDYVATLMSSVTTIVDTISYVLIAFVAISLVVSSIMIGIITYISVLERTKEIGILRAIGASKRNVSQVFNAETFIIGFLAGLIGVGVSLLLLIPGNALIHSLSGNPDVNAALPFAAGVILVIISVLLTLVGGIIPSRAAARKDPVTALRTE